MNFERLGRQSVRLFLVLLLGAAAAVVALALANDTSDPPPMAPMALNSYTQAPSRIVSAHVFDAEGDDIGTVFKLDVDPRGKPIGMQIKLFSTGHLVEVVASNVSFDEGKNIAAVGLSKIEIATMDQGRAE